MSGFIYWNKYAEFSLIHFYSRTFQEIDLNTVEVETIPVSFLQSKYSG